MIFDNELTSSVFAQLVATPQKGQSTVWTISTPHPPLYRGRALL